MGRSLNSCWNKSITLQDRIIEKRLVLEPQQQKKSSNRVVHSCRHLVRPFRPAMGRPGVVCTFFLRLVLLSKFGAKTKVRLKDEPATLAYRFLFFVSPFYFSSLLKKMWSVKFGWKPTREDATMPRNETDAEVREGKKTMSSVCRPFWIVIEIKIYLMGWDKSVRDWKSAIESWENRESKTLGK